MIQQVFQRLMSLLGGVRLFVAAAVIFGIVAMARILAER